MGARLLHRLPPRASALRGCVLERRRLERGAEALRQGLRFLAAAGAALFLAACVPSLHPFYTQKDLAFEQELLGTWAPKGGKAAWAFSAHEPGAYRLAYTDDKGRSGVFAVRLFRLEDRTFLDLYPAELPDAQNDYYRLHHVRAHTLLHVRSLGAQLALAAMNPRWLEAHLRANARALEHERRGESIVLTAETAALQAFVLKHVDAPEAFGKPLVLDRRGGG